MEALVEFLAEELEVVLVGDVPDHEREAAVVEDPVRVHAVLVALGVQGHLAVGAARGVGDRVGLRALALALLRYARTFRLKPSSQSLIFVELTFKL